MKTKIILAVAIIAASIVGATAQSNPHPCYGEYIPTGEFAEDPDRFGQFCPVYIYTCTGERVTICPTGP